MPENVIQLPALKQKEGGDDFRHVVSVDEEARTVEVVFSTGARIPHWMPTREGPRRVMTEVVVDQSAAMLDRLNAGAPVLNDHDDWSVRQVIGVVEKAWIADGAARATIRFSQADDVKPIWDRVREGVLRNCSMGFSIHEAEVVLDGDGDELWRLTKWEPFEISMVPLGADPGAKTQGADAPLSDARVRFSKKEAAMPDNGIAAPAAPVVQDDNPVVTQATTTPSFAGGPRRRPRRSPA